MKTMPVEGLGAGVAEQLSGGGAIPVLLTENAAAVGLLIGLPPDVRRAGVDAAQWTRSADGTLAITVRTREPIVAGQADVPFGEPRFGRCRGMLTVVAEDDEHLGDFSEYM